MITILHTGQTGVERGADRAARTLGLRVRGFCQLDSRDELGPIPAHIARDLTPVLTRGARIVWEPTLELADALIIVAPDDSRIRVGAGMGVLRTAARAHGVPQITVHDASDLDDVARQIFELEETLPGLEVMICGPRATRWAAGERRAHQLVSALGNPPPAASYRVLVLDSHPDTAAHIGRIVELLGHEPIIARTAEQALAQAEAVWPDVGLFDVGALGRTGYDVARQLRSRHSEPLFLAAISGREDDAELAYSAGFDDYVVTPVGVDLIARLIAQATDRLRSSEPMRTNRA